MGQGGTGGAHHRRLAEPLMEPMRVGGNHWRIRLLINGL
jgi:hypothetical protein